MSVSECSTRAPAGVEMFITINVGSERASAFRHCSLIALPVDSTLRLPLLQVPSNCAVGARFEHVNIVSKQPEGTPRAEREHPLLIDPTLVSPPSTHKDDSLARFVCTICTPRNTSSIPVIRTLGPLPSLHFVVGFSHPSLPSPPISMLFSPTCVGLRIFKAREFERAEWKPLHLESLGISVAIIGYWWSQGTEECLRTEERTLSSEYLR